MSLSRPFIVRIAAAWGITLAVGCSLGEAMKAAPRPTHNCTSDTECSTARGESCVRLDGSSIESPSDGSGICIVRGNMEMTQVYFEIQPVDQAISVQLEPINPTQQQNMLLKVPTPIDVAGVVKDEASSATVQAQTAISFRSVPLIPGRVQTFETTTSNDGPDQYGHFTRRLPQGSYTVTVQPPNHAGIPVPPQRFENVKIDQTLTELSLPVANPNYLVYPKGVLQTAKNGATTPLGNIGVRAVEIGRSGDAMASSTLISRTVTTDEGGSFQLGLLPLPKDDGSSPLRLQVGPFQTNALFPTFWDLPLKVRAKPDTIPESAFELPPLELPGELIKVQGSVIDQNGAPVAGAKVIFVSASNSRTSSGRFSFSNTTVSRDDGTYEIQLYPAEYTAIAQPALDPSEDVPMRMGLCGVTPTGTGIPVRIDAAIPGTNTTVPLLACEQQQWIDGWVLRRDQALISNATIEAFRHPTPEFPNGVKFQTKSQSDGSFSMPVYTGTYDLLIRPPESSKLPYYWYPNFKVNSQDNPHPVGHKLYEPYELFGQVVDETTGQPIQATIEAFVSNGEGGSVRIGRATSSSSGQYRLILPATWSETNLLRPSSRR